MPLTRDRHRPKGEVKVTKDGLLTLDLVAENCRGLAHCHWLDLAPFESPPMKTLPRMLIPMHTEDGRSARSGIIAPEPSQFEVNDTQEHDQ